MKWRNTTTAYYINFSRFLLSFSVCRARSFCISVFSMQAVEFGSFCSFVISLSEFSLILPPLYFFFLFVTSTSRIVFNFLGVEIFPFDFFISTFWVLIFCLLESSVFCSLSLVLLLYLFSAMFFYTLSLSRFLLVYSLVLTRRWFIYRRFN